MKKYMTVLEMTRFPIYMTISLIAGLTYVQGIMSGKLMMIMMSPIYVIAIYNILWFQNNNYTIVNKDILSIIPLTEKSKSKCCNFAILSNAFISALILTVILVCNHNNMGYFIILNFILIISVFYGSARLEMDSMRRTVFNIIAGLATSVIFIVEGAFML